MFADDYSFFAVFHFASNPYYRPVPGAILSELMSAITNKLKFLICPHYGYFYLYDVGPETLLVTYESWKWRVTNAKMLREILNKRWQTLDLKSMMSELQRSSSGLKVTKDTLSSVHRFKRKEGASLS